MEIRAVVTSLLLVGVAIGVSRRHRLGIDGELLVAAGRAIAQLFGLAHVVQAVYSHFGLTGLLLAVMVSAATWTSTRRLRGVPGANWIAGTAITASSGLAACVLFGTGAFETEPRIIIPIAGMLTGNSMIAASLAGARLRDDLAHNAPDIEARLALGVPVTAALGRHVRKAIVTALTPTIDSTKNVGLVFLAGAFVGMMIAGATPARAASIQLVVLFMLLGTVSIAALITTSLVARAFIAPGQRMIVPDGLS